jgi:hypothetical protein
MEKQYKKLWFPGMEPAKAVSESIQQKPTKDLTKQGVASTFEYERWSAERKATERNANEPLELERLAVAQKESDLKSLEEAINNPTYLTECAYYVDVAGCTIRCIARYCAECDDYKSKKRK